MRCVRSFDNIQMLRLFVHSSSPFNFRITVQTYGILISNDKKNWSTTIVLDNKEWESFYKKSNKERDDFLKFIIKSYIDSATYETEETDMELKPGTINIRVYDSEYFKVGHAYRVKLNEVDPDHRQYNGLEVDAIVKSFDAYLHNMTIFWINYDKDNKPVVYQLTIPVEWYLTGRVNITPMSIVDDDKKGVE